LCLKKLMAWIELKPEGCSIETEAGTIRFGDSNHSIKLSTVGQWFLSRRIDPELQHTDRL
jgi:hypothetical protein